MCFHKFSHRMINLPNAPEVNIILKSKVNEEQAKHLVEFILYCPHVY